MSPELYDLIHPVDFVDLLQFIKGSAGKRKFSAQSVDLNLPAMYTGLLPCADCSGLNYQLILEKEQFVEFYQYQGRSPEKFKETGTWKIDGDTLTLKGEENLILKRFLIGDEKLTLLDRNNQQIAGDLADAYILERTGNQASIRKHHQELANDGFRFFAAGNEPFWSLKIDSLNRLTLETPDSSTNLGEVTPSVLENGVLFETSAGSTTLTIRIQDEYCRDSMSGYLFPQTVEATFQTAEMDTLRGCALFLNN